MIVAVADSHAIHWHIFSDTRLSNTAKNFIDNSANDGDQIAVSSITFIELVYLIEKGRIPHETLSRMARAVHAPNGVFIEIPVDLTIARAMSRVDVQQIPDMPDRIIAAMAVHLNVPLISRDGKIRLSTVQTIW